MTKTLNLEQLSEKIRTDYLVSTLQSIGAYANTLACFAVQAAARAPDGDGLDMHMVQIAAERIEQLADGALEAATQASEGR